MHHIVLLSHGPVETWGYTTNPDYQTSTLNISLIALYFTFIKYFIFMCVMSCSFHWELKKRGAMRSKNTMNKTKMTDCPESVYTCVCLCVCLCDVTWDFSWPTYRTWLTGHDDINMQLPAEQQSVVTFVSWHRLRLKQQSHFKQFSQPLLHVSGVKFFLFFKA